MKELYGTGVALVTPFTQSGEVDFKGLAKLLRHTAKGVDYFVVMGTTGESATVSSEEKAAILSFVKLNNPRKLPIVYGIGGNHTDEVIEEMHHTDLDGVSAILSVSPYYNKPSQDGIFHHFAKIARTSPLPIILYNVPSRTSSNMQSNTIVRLAKAYSKIIGVKEASGDIEQCMNIIHSAPKSFMVISGEDLSTVPLYALGGMGVISVLANALPIPFKKMKEYAQKGNFKSASREQFKLLGINDLMYEEGNPVGVKALLHQLNICEPFVRLPHTPASPGLIKRIKSALKTTKG